MFSRLAHTVVSIPALLSCKFGNLSVITSGTPTNSPLFTQLGQMGLQSVVKAGMLGPSHSLPFCPMASQEYLVLVT